MHVCVLLACLHPHRSQGHNFKDRLNMLLLIYLDLDIFVVLAASVTDLILDLTFKESSNCDFIPLFISGIWGGGSYLTTGALANLQHQ